MNYRPMKKITRVRQSDRGVLERVGLITTIVGALVLLGMLAFIVSSLPELRRYMKIETM
jgi:hypothetical protein